MIPLEVAFLFSGAALALALAPGPDNIFVLTQSAAHGRLAGLFVILGLGVGLLCHTTAVAFGVAALVEASPYAFTVIKFAGAAYLLFLAWKAWSASKANLSGDDAPQETNMKLFLRGWIMNITNPKVTIFFLALLPQFVDPTQGPIVPQFFQLGVIMILAMFVVFGIVALCASFIGDYLRRSPNAQNWMNRVSAIVFVGLALKLAVTQK